MCQGNGTSCFSWKLFSVCVLRLYMMYLHANIHMGGLDWVESIHETPV